MDIKTLKPKFLTIRPSALKWSAIAGGIVLLGVLAVMFRGQWLPKVSALWATATDSRRVNETEADSHAAKDDGGHNQGHAGHDEGTSLHLSPQARKNIRLTTAAVELHTYVRSATIPAMVIGRPGRPVLF